MEVGGAYDRSFAKLFDEERRLRFNLRLTPNKYNNYRTQSSSLTPSLLLFSFRLQSVSFNEGNKPNV